MSCGRAGSRTPSPTSSRSPISSTLKLLDEEEAARELKDRLGAGNGARLFPLQAERYRWSKWRFKSGAALRDFVRDEVFAYVASLVKDEPRVAQYFRDAVLEITDPNVLEQVVDELDSIDFRKLGPDVKGDVFEYLLTHLGQASLNGQFRTLRQIRAFMVEMVDPDLGDTLYDPACGTAGFLIDAVDHILARYSETPEEVPIYGEDWLEKRGQTLEEARKTIPTLQTYRKGSVFRRPVAESAEGQAATRHVWFYEIRNDGYDPDKIQGGGRPETPEKNDIPDLLAAWGGYKASRYREPPGVEANAVLKPGSDEPRCWWAPFDDVAESDYNLAASRYKPHVAEKAPDEDPAELIRDVLTIEHEIAAGLEELLGEVER